MTTGKRQRGVSPIGGLLILVVVCFVALLVIRIVPIYISYFTVKSTLEGLAHDPTSRQMSVSELHSSLQKRFDIGYVSVVDARQVKISQQGRERIVSLTYEDRRPLIGNLDIVANFDINVVLAP
jgi:flagellin-like protein